MLYALICIDKPDRQQLRLDTRPAHLEYLEAIRDSVKFAGPFTNEDASQMTGSLLIIEAATLQDAKAIAGKDPYSRAGLFADVQIRPWKWTVGNPDA